MKNAIMEMTSRLSKTTGADICVNCENDEFVISVYTRGKIAYSIICDDEDDCYNTLSAMVDGARLVIDMKEGKACFEN